MFFAVYFPLCGSKYYPMHIKFEVFALNGLDTIQQNLKISRVNLLLKYTHNRIESCPIVTVTVTTSHQRSAPFWYKLQDCDHHVLATIALPAHLPYKSTASTRLISERDNWLELVHAILLPGAVTNIAKN